MAKACQLLNEKEIHNTFAIILCGGIYMASIDFKKLKTPGEVKAMIRHCDTEERLKHNHSNLDIDKTMTNENVNYTKLTYEQSCKRYDKRIEYLDSQPGANLRKDRVTAFGLTVPACENMTKAESEDFFLDVCRLFQKEFGYKNIISAIGHYDEIHSYIDHGELKESRPHLQFYVIPEIDGKLNGKKFSSKKRMMELNQKVEAIAKEKYNKRFLTHEKPRKRTVEELKRITNSEQEKLLLERTKIEQERNKLEQECNELEREIKKLTATEKGTRELFNDTKANLLQLLDIAKGQGYNFDEYLVNQQRAGSINRIIKKILKNPLPELEKIEKILEPIRQQKQEQQDYDLDR